MLKGKGGCERCRACWSLPDLHWIPYESSRLPDSSLEIVMQAVVSDKMKRRACDRSGTGMGI